MDVWVWKDCTCAKDEREDDGARGEDVTRAELLNFMKEALIDDEKCLVLGDYLETRGIEISECLATQGLALLLSIECGNAELQRKFRRDQRVADIRVRTREVLREMGEEIGV